MEVILYVGGNPVFLLHRNKQYSDISFLGYL